MEPQWFDTITEEYKSLRTESLEALRRQATVLQVGLALIGVLLAAGFSGYEDIPDPLVWVLFGLIIPVLSYTILFIWLGEVERMARAGYYLTGLEKKINNSFSHPREALEWEQWLREFYKAGPLLQMEINYAAIPFMLIGGAFIAFLLSIKPAYDFILMLKSNYTFFGVGRPGRFDFFIQALCFYEVGSVATAYCLSNYVFWKRTDLMARYGETLNLDRANAGTQVEDPSRKDRSSD